MTRLALAQMPRKLRRRVLVRTEPGGGTCDFVKWLASPSRRLHYPVGITITEDMQDAILTLPERVWDRRMTPSGRCGRARGSRLTGLLDLEAGRRGCR